MPSSLAIFVPTGCVTLPLFAPIQPAFSTKLLPEYRFTRFYAILFSPFCSKFRKFLVFDCFSDFYIR
jgi:hypothetical protein